MIVRIKRRRDQPFVVLDRHALRLTTLSFKARGVWAHCMTYPDDWTINLKHLAAQSERDGLTALRSAFKELEAVGLASLETTRAGAGAIRGKRWVLYEVPDLNPHRRTGLPDVEKTRTTEHADVEKTRTSGNRTLRSKEADESRKEVRMNEQQQTAPPVASAGDGAATPLQDLLPAALSEDAGSAAFRLLTARGVDEPVARRLAGRHDAERIAALVRRFDAENADGAGHTPGWLVAALREGYAVHAPKHHPERLLTYDEAREAYVHLTGGDPLRPFDRYFEPVRTDRGIFFRRKPSSLQPVTLPPGNP